MGENKSYLITQFKYVAGLCKTGRGMLFIISFVISTMFFIISEYVAQYSIITSSYFIFSIAAGGLFMLAISFLFRAQWLLPLQSVFLNITHAGLIFATISVPLLFYFLLHKSFNPDFISASIFMKFLFTTLPWLAIILFCWVVLKLNGLLSHRISTTSCNLPFTKYSIIAIFIPPITVSLNSFYYFTFLRGHPFSGMSMFIHFSAAVQACLACAYLILFFSRNRPEFSRVFNDIHYKNLTSLIFVFSLLYAYTSYFQHIIIYSANITRQVEGYSGRLDTPFNLIYLFTIIFRVIIPFIVFLFNKLKTNRVISAFVCELIILSHFYDVLFNVVYSESTHFLLLIGAVGFMLINIAFFTGVYINIYKNRSTATYEHGENKTNFVKEI